MFNIKLNLELICIGSQNKKENTIKYEWCESYTRKEVDINKDNFKREYKEVFEVEELMYDIFSCTIAVDDELVFKDMVDDNVGLEFSPLSLGVDKFLEFINKFVAPTKYIRKYSID